MAQIVAAPIDAQTSDSSQSLSSLNSFFPRSGSRPATVRTLSRSRWQFLVPLLDRVSVAANLIGMAQLLALPWEPSDAPSDDSLDSPSTVICRWPAPPL